VFTSAWMSAPQERPEASSSPRRGWRPGSRVARLHANHSYAFVLILIAALFLVLIAAPQESWALSVVVLLGSALLAVALWASGLGFAGRTVALLVIGGIAASVQLASGGATVTGLVWLLDVALVAGTMVVIAFGVFDQREINRQSISGAICIYLLLGILYTFVYGAVAALQSGPFFAQGTDGTTAVRVYFSYVTMATVGYGDYTAATSLGRSLAITESLLGQLYLVTVVALLVGHFGERKREREPA